MKRAFLASSFAFLSVLGFARADDAVPSDELRWDVAVKTFADVLAGGADRDALDGILSDHSWVAPFARNRTEAVHVLPERLAGMTVVSARGCLQPSVTSATDLVADVTASAVVAESIRRKLVPPDGQDLRQADATMARWFGHALEAQAGDPVALLALYDAGQPTPNGSTPPTLVLLLVRGEFAANGSARISRVLYGSLDSAVH